MIVNLKPDARLKALKALNLQRGKVYVCLESPWMGFQGKVIIGVNAGSIFGVWLNVNNAVLSTLTAEIDKFSFKEIQVEINEV